VYDGAAPAIGPVPADERITLIDCLRGAALFGIVMANMRGFNAPLAAYMRPELMGTWLPDRITQALVDWLITGKFITIFAGLFGIGFSMQMERAAAHGRNVSFFGRRMVVLFLIGLAHSWLLWWGDILTNYAVCGFFLLSFRASNQRTILVWAHTLYWFLVVLFTGVWIATLLGAHIDGDSEAMQLPEVVRTYAHGTVAQIFVTRFREWVEANAFVIFLTRIVGTFLFGVYIWRQGYLRTPSAHLEWWKKARRIGFPVGLIANGIAVLIAWYFQPNPEQPTAPSVVLFALESLGVPALSLAYTATVVILWQDSKWQQRLLPFSFVGRMALTNYLLQSLIFTTIFYSYGFGLYGRVGPLANIFFAVIVYLLQIPFSQWWLSRHRYGPVEWLWRLGTYGRINLESPTARNPHDTPA
jgi:uncharacterized protein